MLPSNEALSEHLELTDVNVFGVELDGEAYVGLWFRANWTESTEPVSSGTATVVKSGWDRRYATSVDSEVGPRCAHHEAGDQVTWRPSPYARQMAGSMLSLAEVFDELLPHKAEHERRKAVIRQPERWSEARGERERVRDLLLCADGPAEAQFYFIEACLETVYNETAPPDPFDSVTPYGVVPRALELAEAIGLDRARVMDAV